MKLSINDRIKYEELSSKIQEGGRFIAYRYIVSRPLFYPVNRISKLFFIEKNEKASKYAWSYNVLNFLLGIWGLPFGPAVMIKSIFINLKGGIDLTEDVLVNLTKEAFDKKEIEMLRPGNMFVAPTKSNLKELGKVTRELRSKNIVKGEIVVGYFIDTKENESPYYALGFSNDLEAVDLQKIRNEIRKRFYKHVKFEFFSLDEENNEFVQRLKKEGVKLN